MPRTYRASSTSVALARAAALAHHLQPVTQAMVAHVMDHARHEDSPRGAQRVTERDGPAERVDQLRIGAGLG
jgi:hypothetical protein